MFNISNLAKSTVIVFCFTLQSCQSEFDSPELIRKSPVETQETYQKRQTSNQRREKADSEIALGKEISSELNLESSNSQTQSVNTENENLEEKATATSPSAHLAQQYLENFRGTFSNIVYKLGARGPNAYDCSSSIAYLFIKMKLIKDSSGALVEPSAFSRGLYNAAYMDFDSINFRVLDKSEHLKPADLILVGKHCDKPTHWALISEINDNKQGHFQTNFKTNRILEVTGNPKGAMQERWEPSAFENQTLCAAVRHRLF